MVKMMDLSSYSFLVLLIITTFERSLESEAQVTDSDLKKLGTANNDLAVNIYRQLATGSNGNIFFSPLSLSTAFGMLYYGTRGDTAEELKKALGYEIAGLEENSVHQTFKNYLTEILPSQDTTAYTLNTANAIYLDKESELVPDYKTEVQDYYQATVKDVDFATQGPQIVHQINDWVREKTNGKIAHLLDSLNPSTLMILLNAVYFKGAWETQFDPKDTKPRIFYNNGLQSGETKTATMFMIKTFPYAENNGVEVLEMPYRGDNISMVLLLPKQRDGLESLERSLNLTTFSELRSKLYKQRVLVMVPKFNLEFSRELSGAFQSIGAKEVFTPGADFSGITTSGRRISVNQVFHKAVIEVNEGGTEAAAVTGIVAVRSIPSFRADHPFLFAIIDRRNDMILFMGRVTNL